MPSVNRYTTGNHVQMNKAKRTGAQLRNGLPHHETLQNTRNMETASIIIKIVRCHRCLRQTGQVCIILHLYIIYLIIYYIIAISIIYFYYFVVA